MNNDDNYLIENFLNNDLISQEILYDKYKKIINNFLRKKFLINYNEDDVSEILIRVFLNLKEFDSTKSKFRSWVFSIAKNYMIDKWRTGITILTSNFDNTLTVINNTSCKSFVSTGNSSGDWSDFANSNNYAISDSRIMSNTDFENCSSINYISKQLSPVDFTLLNMKYVQGYDYSEIGKEFNVTSTTISNRVNYIKTKLKKNNPEIEYD